MLVYQEALVIIQNLASSQRKSHAIQTETVSIADAVNRILASDILSPEDVPSFNNSAMDGFAVASADTLTASKTEPVMLKVTETIGAGEFSQQTDRALGTCIEIMTGAPVPDQYDAVVKVEDVELVRDDGTGVTSVKLSRAVLKNENIRHRGEDYKVGGPLLSRATVLMPEHVMALATLGVAQVQVYRKPRVVVINTGKELVHYSTQKLQPSQIRNSTGLFLLNFLRQMGCDVDFAGTISDSPEEFSDLLTTIELARPDVILTTGAVSMGKYDFIKSTLLNLGVDILFHKVAIRPGKPVLFAKMKSGTAFFGLPGNPISTAVGTRFFLTPYLKALLGQKPEAPLKARLEKETSKPEGLRCFFKAQVNFADHRVKSLPGQASFMISPFTNSNAWLVFSEDGSRVSEGTEVDVFPIYPLQYNWGNL